MFVIVVLLDTREARDYLNWDKTSNNGNLNDGWGELSFEAKIFPSLLLPSSTSTLWRTQYVCDITSERQVDNWLRSPYFKRQQAQRIEIELGFSIRDCSTFQTPNEIRSCRETFELYVHESDFEDNDLLWSSYKLVDVIAGNRFTSNNYGTQSSASNGNNLTVNVKTRGIPINKNGFYIAFRDQGACVSLLYVKIFYRLCQDTSIGLVHFPETPTGSHLTDIVERHGICTINSKPIHKPLGFCKGNGMLLRLFYLFLFFFLLKNLSNSSFKANGLFKKHHYVIVVIAKMVMNFSLIIRIMVFYLVPFARVST